RAAALGFDGIARVGVVGVLDQLERDGVAGHGVHREVHIGHAAAAQLLADLVFANLAAGRCDHLWPLPPSDAPRPLPASGKKFWRRISSRSPGTSSGLRSITL